MATLKGQKVVWGVGGIYYAASIVGIHQSAKNQASSDKEYIRDVDGEVAGTCYYGHLRNFTATIVPSGADVATANTNLQTLDALLPGASITVTDGTLADSALVYNLNGYTINRTNTGHATADLDLERSPLNTITTA